MGWDVMAALVAATVASARLVRHPAPQAAAVLMVYIALASMAYGYTGFLPGLVFLLISGLASALLVLTSRESRRRQVGPSELFQSAGSLIVAVIATYLASRSVEFSRAPWLDGAMIWVGVWGLTDLAIHTSRAGRMTGMFWLALATYTLLWVALPQASLIALAALALFSVGLGLALNWPQLLKSSEGS